MNGHEERKHRNAMKAARGAAARAKERAAEQEHMLDELLAPVVAMKGNLDLQKLAEDEGLVGVFRTGYHAALCDVRKALEGKTVLDDGDLEAWADFAHTIYELGRKAYEVA